MQTMTMSVVVSVLLGWIPLLTTGPMAIAAQSDLVPIAFSMPMST